MITDEAKYGSLLAVLLMILFVIGNIISPSQRTLSVFPWFVDLLAFPIVLYPAIRAIGIRRHGKSLTVRQGLLIGETITRWAAFLFAVVAAGYAYFRFEHYVLWLAAFVMTVAITWLTGLVSSLLCILLSADGYRLIDHYDSLLGIVHKNVYRRIIRELNRFLDGT